LFDDMRIGGFLVKQATTCRILHLHLPRRVPLGKHQAWTAIQQQQRPGEATPHILDDMPIFGFCVRRGNP